MKEKIREILWNFVAGEVTDSEAVQQVLDLFAVSGSVCYKECGNTQPSGGIDNICLNCGSSIKQTDHQHRYRITTRQRRGKTHNKMKTLKLEVGKIYRNRKGEEVKILRKGNKGWDHWEGSNGEWYYESGKWSYVAKEHPDDLIEEVPETRHTFKIPDGVKEVAVEQIGNRIVVEMVPEEIPEKEQIDKFLKAYADGVIWSREQLRWLIENYLKHREGEK